MTWRWESNFFSPGRQHMFYCVGLVLAHMSITTYQMYRLPRCALGTPWHSKSRGSMDVRTCRTALRNFQLAIVLHTGFHWTGRRSVQGGALVQKRKGIHANIIVLIGLQPPLSEENLGKVGR